MIRETNYYGDQGTYWRSEVTQKKKEEHQSTTHTQNHYPTGLWTEVDPKLLCRGGAGKHSPVCDSAFPTPVNPRYQKGSSEQSGHNWTGFTL